MYNIVGTEFQSEPSQLHASLHKELRRLGKAREVAIGQLHDNSFFWYENILEKCFLQGKCPSAPPPSDATCFVGTCTTENRVVLCCNK